MLQFKVDETPGALHLVPSPQSALGKRLFPSGGGRGPRDSSLRCLPVTVVLCVGSQVRMRLQSAVGYSVNLMFFSH